MNVYKTLRHAIRLLDKDFNNNSYRQCVVGYNSPPLILPFSETDGENLVYNKHSAWYVRKHLLTLR